MKRLRILLSAYVCVPRAGGEDAVGWRWITYLSKHHDVTVLTHSRRKFEKINEYKHETTAEFVFLTLPDWLDWLHTFGWLGKWLHYALWQRFAEKAARRLHQQQPYDLVHHVVYNQYRTPSFGARMGLPFVFGPVGGAETIPLPLFQDLGVVTFVKEGLRSAEIRLREMFRIAPDPNTAYVFSNPSTQRAVIGDYDHPHSYLVPAVYVDAVDLIGMNLEDSPPEQMPLEQNQDAALMDTALMDTALMDAALMLVMPGRMLDWKGPILALRALAKARSRGCNIHLRIVGQIVLDKKIRQLCRALNLEDAVEITTYMPRRELLKLLSRSDAMLYAAFRDSGAMVVAESYLLGKPAIILDIDSQFHIEPHFSVKAAIGKTYAETLDNLANSLQWAFENRSKLPELGAIGKAHLSQSLSWESKLQAIEAIYEKLLGDASSGTLSEPANENLSGDKACLTI